jgi:YfiH family protein
VTGLAWADGPVPVLRWASAPDGVSVAFTSRRGGASQGPYASLNLGALTADEAGRVAENRRRAVAAAGCDPAMATMAWQVHGREVREVIEEPAGGRFLEPGAEPFPRSDGLATSLRGRPMMLLTADCIPVAIARSDGGRLAVLHAGWRGLEAGIVATGAEAVGGEIVGAVGPGAGPCCYEAGEEVHAAIGHSAGRNVDLKAAAAERLRGVGVAHVEDLGICTICDERFFSHRRSGGITGRQAGVAWLD